VSTLLRESQGRIVNIASNCGKCQHYWEKVKAELLILLVTVVSVNITERKSMQNLIILPWLTVSNHNGRKCSVLTVYPWFSVSDVVTAITSNVSTLLRESQCRIVNIASNCGKCQYYWEKVKAELLILLVTVVSVNIT
jgi:bacterioferritin-associated ferredoxin